MPKVDKIKKETDLIGQKKIEVFDLLKQANAAHEQMQPFQKQIQMLNEQVAKLYAEIEQLEKEPS